MLITSGEDLAHISDEVKVQERFVPSHEDNLKKSQLYSPQHAVGNVNGSSSFLEITEVAPHLLLCGAVALRGNVLEDLKVTCVINATNELPDTPLPNSSQSEILYLRVNIEDKVDSRILPWLDLVTDVIHQVKMAGGRTLIHCVAGISRSATLCLAYLVKCEGYTLHDSYHMLKALRRSIRPNSGFFRQLIEFEKLTTGKQTVLMVHSDYTNSSIPHLYEEDYKKLYNSIRGRTSVGDGGFLR